MKLFIYSVFWTLLAVNIFAKETETKSKKVFVQQSMPEEVYLSIKPIEPKDLNKTADNKKKKQDTKKDSQLNFKDIIKIQVFLDKSGFRPGILDGTLGVYTKKALNSFNISQKLEGDDKFSFGDLLLFIENSEIFHKIQLFTEYTISNEDRRYVGSLPSGVVAKSKKSYLPYSSYAELVAEKFHTTTDALKKLNPKKNIYKLRKNSKLTVPNVDEFSVKNVKSVYQKSDIKNHIILDSTERQLKVFDQNDTLIASYPITIGGQKYIKRDKKKKWEIRKIVGMPYYVYDRSVLKQGKTGSVQYTLPSGPNNPVGVMWISLKHLNSNRNTHIGIHGTSRPEKIGTGNSNGCIRLSNWDVYHLKDLVTEKTPVQWK
jgi:lipoprotein-anchoring transpeptidase ErfK/SrfK